MAYGGHSMRIKPEYFYLALARQRAGATEPLDEAILKYSELSSEDAYQFLEAVENGTKSALERERQELIEQQIEDDWRRYEKSKIEEIGELNG